MYSHRRCWISSYFVKIIEGKMTQGSFRQKVKKYICTHLDVEMLFFDSGIHFRSLIEGLFLVKTTLTKEKKAHIILQELFTCLIPGFHFRLPKKKQKQFLTCILYHIFSLTFSLIHLRSKDELTAFLFRIQASIQDFRSEWNELTFSQKIKTVAFCSEHYDEGSFNLLQFLKKSEFSDISKRIQGYQISTKTFWQWANSFKTITKKELYAFLKNQDKEKALRFQSVSESLATLFPDCNFTLHFLDILGLFGSQVPVDSSILLEEMGFDEKLRACIENPDAAEVKIFLAALKTHLQATTEQYKNGLKSIAYCIPTYGRDLAKMPSVQSLLEGAELLSADDFTLIIFDQSSPQQFAKNRAYTQKYSKSIVHLNKKKILEIAKEYGVYDLIVTGPNERFGYAGARNAIFLLAPHLCSRASIMMCDDDLYVPACNMYADALFAYLNKGQYYSRFATIVGRNTLQVYASIDPVSSFTTTSKILSQCEWVQKSILHPMSALLSSPKLCLNIPLGQEESHFLALKLYNFDIRRPSLHLAGFRYPKGIFPTNRYSGLAAYLKQMNGYVFGLLLVSELLDPCNIAQKCALVWNLEQKPCESFQEGVDLILKSTHAMQKQFWNNFELFLQGFSDSEPYNELDIAKTSKIMQRVIALDIDHFLVQYSELHPYILTFKKEFVELKQFFLTTKQQASWLKEFAFTLHTKGRDLQAIEHAREHVEKVSGRSIEQHLFTYSLYTLCKSVGAAGFQKALKVLET